MKVLFVSSGNSLKGISPIVLSQAESLRKSASITSLDYFVIKGKGIKGYLSSIPKLKKFLKNKNIDVIHAHYSLSAIVASLAGAKPLVVSLMGSDVKAKTSYKWIIQVFHKFFWAETIVKSTDMKKSLGIKNIHIIPNGVNFKLHQPLDQKNAHLELGWDKKKKHILFAANPKRSEKNYKLAEKGFQLLEKENVELHFLQNVDHEKIPVHFAASNVTLLTSLWEGSPNVVKEAMACNCPIVATGVGDVKWLFGEEPGYFITGFNAEDVAKQLRLALDFSKKHGRTNGRKRIKNLGLGAETVANKIIDVYKKTIQEK